MTPSDLTGIVESIGREHQPAELVARRLGKSLRWLQALLTEDSRKPVHQQRLQHHHFVGRSKRWSEREYRALEAEIVAQSGRRACASSSATASGTSTAP